jgi:acyl dehydratase
MVQLSSYRVRARNLAPDSDNKIHDDDVAQQFGFSGALVPGVELFAYLSHPLVEAWGTGFFDGGRLEARFRRPVYDGDELAAAAEPDDSGTFAATLTGPDGVVRAVGRAWPPDGSTTPRRDYPSMPAPRQLLPTGPESLPLGPLGSVEEPVTVERHDAYLDGIGETLPIYRDVGLVHPGAQLRIVNELLMRNVALGPWIHTASNCRFLAVPKLGSMLRAHGIVTEVFERNGHHYVRYDALVLSDDLPVMEADHTAIYRLASTAIAE